MPDYDSDSYCTPKAIVDFAREVLGGPIHLDPASNDYAQTTIQANRYFTIEGDGLESNWGKAKRVFLNPPYSQPACRLFCEKAIKHVTETPGAQAMVLINASTSTRHFHALVDACFEFGIFQGRIPFPHPDPRAPQNRNRYDQAMFWLVNPFAEMKSSTIFRELGADIVIEREGMPDLPRPLRAAKPL